ncbi:hypothetical protein L1987_53020 [Smallanthus sonchifolius]|uniref:Uncharacterized protein n=1 Tax=Smallanthus sonchifolius TaxID=185202 RepID=A0ACB9EV39_9ASTR|nr:hypothetical protein L1987_53020 [Smallanthus sonchifolius]
MFMYRRKKGTNFRVVQFWLAASGRAKWIHFARVNPGATGMSAKCIRRFKPGQGFWEQWEHGACSGYSSKHRWVLKTGFPNGKSLLGFLQEDWIEVLACLWELKAWRTSVIGNLSLFLGDGGLETSNSEVLACS